MSGSITVLEVLDAHMKGDKASQILLSYRRITAGTYSLVFWELMLFSDSIVVTVKHGARKKEKKVSINNDQLADLKLALEYLRDQHVVSNVPMCDGGTEEIISAYLNCHIGGNYLCSSRRGGSDIVEEYNWTRFIRGFEELLGMESGELFFFGNDLREGFMQGSGC